MYETAETSRLIARLEYLINHKGRTKSEDEEIEHTKTLIASRKFKEILSELQVFEASELGSRQFWDSEAPYKIDKEGNVYAIWKSDMEHPEEVSYDRESHVIYSLQYLKYARKLRVGAVIHIHTPSGKRAAFIQNDGYLEMSQKLLGQLDVYTDGERQTVFTRGLLSTAFARLSAL